MSISRQEAAQHAHRWMMMSAAEHVVQAAEVVASGGRLELAQLHATLAVAKGGTSPVAIAAYLEQLGAPA